MMYQEDSCVNPPAAHPGDCIIPTNLEDPSERELTCTQTEQDFYLPCKYIPEKSCSCSD